MAEYIKREDVREKIEEIIDDEWYCPTEERLNRAVEQTMSELPSIDIVHCKDCEYYEHTQYGAFCNNVYGLHEDTDGDDYCSYAERKEDDDGQGKSEKV